MPDFDKKTFKRVFCGTKNIIFEGDTPEKAIQRLQHRIDTLVRRIEKLEKQNKDLRKENNILKSGRKFVRQGNERTEINAGYNFKY